MAFHGVPSLPLPSPPAARLPCTFCLPFLYRIRRRSSPITFKMPAVVSDRPSTFSRGSRVVIVISAPFSLVWILGKGYIPPLVWKQCESNV